MMPRRSRPFSERPQDGFSVRNILGPATCVLLLAMVAGCTMTGVRQRTVSAREVYKYPASFHRGDLVEEGVTVLAPQLNVGQEAMGQVFLESLLESLDGHLSTPREKEVGLVHPYRLAQSINRADLTTAYARMIQQYNRTGILRGELLNRFRDLVGVRYFAVPILMNFQEREAPRLTPFGFRMINTARATARFQLQIWDSRTQQVVWEGTSDLTLARDTFLEQPIRFSEIVSETWDALIQKMPRQPD